MLSSVRIRCAYGEASVWPRGQPGRSCFQQPTPVAGELKCPFSPVLHGFARLAKPGTERPTQAGVAGWPDFDPDFAEVPGLIEPYLSAIRPVFSTVAGGGCRAPVGRQGHALQLHDLISRLAHGGSFHTLSIPLSIRSDRDRRNASDLL